jgi:hypothetical protein
MTVYRIRPCFHKTVRKYAHPIFLRTVSWFARKWEKFHHRLVDGPWRHSDLTAIRTMTVYRIRPCFRKTVRSAHPIFYAPYRGIF